MEVYMEHFEKLMTFVKRFAHKAVEQRCIVKRGDEIKLTETVIRH